MLADRTGVTSAGACSLLPSDSEPPTVEAFLNALSRLSTLTAKSASSAPIASDVLHMLVFIVVRCSDDSHLLKLQLPLCGFLLSPLKRTQGRVEGSGGLVHGVDRCCRQTSGQDCAHKHLHPQLIWGALRHQRSSHSGALLGLPPSRR